MNEAKLGKEALSNSKFDEAVKYFTLAIKAAPRSPDYFIQRSTAHQRAKNYQPALEDAEQGIRNAQQRHKREAIIEAQFRRGCALHSLERYGDAKFVFEIVKRMDDKHKTVAVWLGRNENMLNKPETGDDKKQVNVKEIPDEPATSAEEAKTAPTNGTSSTSTTSAGTPATPQQTPQEKIRHEWYQNTDNVYFTLLAKGVPKDKAQIDIQERSLSISFPLATGAQFDFTLDPLFAPVKPEKCIPKILPSKIEIVLVKANAGQKWSVMESSEPAAAAPKAEKNGDASNDAVKQAVLNSAPPATSGPAYPTSSKTGPKNWDKVVGDVDDDEYEGGDEANGFFQKLYKDAPPDTKKAMMKSFQESNGTALSTNWEEVSKGRVETVPPDGMEAKPYEQ